MNKMKFALFLTLVLNFLYVSAQTPASKNRLLLDIGIGFYQLTPKYFPSWEDPLHPSAETLYPGKTSYPECAIKSSLHYDRAIGRGFFVSSLASFTYRHQKITRSPDSIAKYYLYPDSVKAYKPYNEVNAPILSIHNKIQFAIGLGLGYRYRRFTAWFGGEHSFAHYMHFRNSYLNNDDYIHSGIFWADSKKMIINNIIHYSIINFRLECMFGMKTQLPVSAYLEIRNDNIFCGAALHIKK